MGEGHQDWYLTTDGLYCPEISYYLPRQHFYPKTQRLGTPSATLTEAPPVETPQGEDPAGIDSLALRRTVSTEQVGKERGSQSAETLP